MGLREVRYGYAGANHLSAPKDTSNPYFTFDASKCIVCSRCVRACDEQQGTLALTIQGRGFDSTVAASQNVSFMDSECVSCGACVQACPTATLSENTLIAKGQAEHSVTTTCAYCGVGCSFRAEMQGEEVVRMVPNQDGHANHGHSCVKGRFAIGYATHPDRIYKPMIREKISDPWREVSWEEAIGHAASELKRIQAKYGRNSIGGITSSRCTNEETYLVQKLVRAGFGNNNVDTCARVCHSPTGYGLKNTMGESAGTQNFDSVMKADVIFVIGANPTDGHPVFASQMKRRLRQGAHLIVADPRGIDLVRSPHIQADHHLKLRPGTNVALINSIAHVDRHRGAGERGVRARALRSAVLREMAPLHRPAVQLPGGHARDHRRPGERGTRGGAPVRHRGQWCDLLRARRHRTQPGLDHGDGHRESRHGHRQHRTRGRRASTRCAARTMCKARATWARFRTSSPATGTSRTTRSAHSSSTPGACSLQGEPGLRIPNMFEAALDGEFKGLYIEGEDIAQSDPNTQHVTAALQSMECIIVQDLFLNESAKFAHVFLPGSSFLEKDGTFTNAERRISRVRKVMQPKGGYADWEITQLLANAVGYPMNYAHPGEIMDEIARLTPTFTGVSFARLDELGSIQWPCNAAHPDGTPTMHVGEFVRGKGKFLVTEYVPTEREGQRQVPADPDHRAHPEPVQRRRADAAHRKQPLARRGSPGDSSARRRGARHRRRRLGRRREPCRRDGAARARHRAGAAGRGVYHLPLS